MVLNSRRESCGDSQNSSESKWRREQTFQERTVSFNILVRDASRYSLFGRFLETVKDPKTWLMAFFAGSAYVFEPSYIHAYLSIHAFCQKHRELCKKLFNNSSPHTKYGCISAHQSTPIDCLTIRVQWYPDNSSWLC